MNRSVHRIRVLFILHPSSLILSRLDALWMSATFVQNVDALLDAVVDSVGVQAVLCQQQFCVAVRDEPIGNSHAHHANLVLQPVLFE